MISLSRLTNGSGMRAPYTKHAISRLDNGKSEAPQRILSARNTSRLSSQKYQGAIQRNFCPARPEPFPSPFNGCVKEFFLTCQNTPPMIEAFSDVVTYNNNSSSSQPTYKHTLGHKQQPSNVSGPAGRSVVGILPKMSSRPDISQQQQQPRSTLDLRTGLK